MLKRDLSRTRALSAAVQTIQSSEISSDKDTYQTF